MPIIFAMLRLLSALGILHSKGRILGKIKESLVYSLLAHVLVAIFFLDGVSRIDKVNLELAPLDIEFIAQKDIRLNSSKIVKSIRFKRPVHLDSKGKTVMADAEKILNLQSTVSTLVGKIQNGDELTNPNFRPLFSQSETYNFGKVSEQLVLPKEKVSYINNIWKYVDGAIADNPYLSEYGKNGDVYFKFAIDANGNLVESSIVVNANDNVLKVLAAKAVRNGLKEAQRNKFILPEEVTLMARFSWHPSSCVGRQGIKDDALGFCRYVPNEKKKFTASEKIGTYVGSIATYGFGAIEEIKKYNREQRRRENKFNPFQNIELDPDWNLGS